MKDTYSTDDSKQLFQSKETSNLNYVNGFLFYIYLFLLIIAIFILSNHDVSIIYKILIISIAVIYPFVIYPIEFGIYNLFLYIWAVLNGNVYSMSDY